MLERDWRRDVPVAVLAEKDCSCYEFSRQPCRGFANCTVEILWLFVSMLLTTQRGAIRQDIRIDLQCNEKRCLHDGPTKQTDSNIYV